MLSQLDGEPNRSAGRPWCPANGLGDQLRRQERTGATSVLLESTEQCLDVVADRLHAAWRLNWHAVRNHLSDAAPAGRPGELRHECAPPARPVSRPEGRD